MDKRILALGSIIAVIILIFTLFNSVVGFQSNSISSVKTSPLFNTRTQRALQDENNDISTCYYVRKGKPLTIPIPTLDNKMTLIRQLIDRINKIDNEIFNKIKALVDQLNTDHKGNNEPLYIQHPEPSTSEIFCTMNYKLECWPTFHEVCTTLPVACITFLLGSLLTVVITIPILIIWLVIFYTEQYNCLPSLILLPRCS